MTSVFLSYDRDDTERARPIALALEKAGHSVWWDLHIRGGEQFSKVIDEALKAADAVVVLWSKNSIESPWVRDEAAAGRDTGRLVPVSLDDTEPPLGFRQFQTIDLTRWKGRGKSPQLNTLLGDIASMVRAPDDSETIPAPAPISQSWTQQRLISNRTLWACAAIVLAILVLALWWMKPWFSSQAPSVAITTSNSSAASKSLADDLFVKLGSLQASSADAIELIEADSGQAPTLIFEVAGDAKAPEPHASLILLDGRDRSLFWSKEFSAPAGRAADLKQQLSFTAAKVLQCAVEALTSEAGRLRQETIKLYLNGCSSFTEVLAYDPRPLIPVFRTVVEQAPRFEGAWAKLLHAEAEVVTSSDWRREGEKLKPQLLKDMAQARKLNPDMAELLMVEADLSPPLAFAQRMRLLERAVERNPDNPSAHAAYAMFLMHVGRSYESVDRAKRAAQLDPLSPLTRDAVISALTYNGDFDAALEELRQAEQLWPGASNLLSARYRIHLRYGDPNEALKIQRLGDFGGPHRDAFIQARLNPSPANIEKAISYPRHWLQSSPSAIGELAQVLGAFGREEELFQVLLRWQHPEEIEDIVNVLFRPALATFRRDPRMIVVAKRIGLLDYWQQSGDWPDFCSEPDLPYDCKGEAAKLAGPQ